MIDVSIIIVSWNTRQILKDCLDSIYDQTQGIEFETIVVDNDSSDGSPEMVSELFPNVILIKNQNNVGFAKGNNQGIELGKGRYILLLNSDTIILDNAITKSIRYIDRQPEIGIMGCRVVNPDLSLQPTCFQYPSLLNLFLSMTYLYKIFPKNRFFGRERMSWWDRSDARPVDVVTGCYMLIRLEVCEQIGGLDETYFMYGEETDFCYRAKQRGWKVWFAPVANIVHLGGASSKKMRLDMILQLRASLLYFIKNHHCCLSYRLACLLISLFFLLRVPYWLFKGICVKSDRTRSFERSKTYFYGALKALWGAGALRKKPDIHGDKK
jgi:GT2 family glycosyltransferase